MAEFLGAIGIAANITSLVGFADVLIQRVVKYIHAVKHGKEEIASLLFELSTLHGILHGLKALTREYPQQDADTRFRADHLRSCYLTLDTLQKRLTDKLNHADPAQQRNRFKALQQRYVGWPLSKSETTECIKELQGHKSTLNLALTSDNSENLLRALSMVSEIKAEVKRSGELHDRLDRLIIDKESQAVLDFLCPVKSAYGSPKAMNFKDWFQSPKAKLWMNGIAGAGKTILMSLIIRHTQENAGQDDAVAYFYCDYKDSKTQKPANILGSLAQQLASRDEHTLSRAKTLYAQHHPEGKPSSQATPEQLRDVILEVSNSLENVFIIVDGLDECSDARPVVDILKSLTGSVKTNTKLLFASRDERAIRDRLQKEYVEVSIAARSEDLKRYVLAEVQTRMDQDRLRIRQNELKEHIVERLVEKADGMFRWVTCQIDFLCTLANDRERREALEKLPPTLAETYERILQRANFGGESIQLIVQKSLQWLTFSMEPLTLSSLAEALSIELGVKHLNVDDVVDEAAILDGCGSLIRVSTPEKVVELAHFTVQEFLTSIKAREGVEFLRYHVEEELAGLYMAKTCLAHCCVDTFASEDVLSEDDLDAESQKYPFRTYAVSFWFDHARRHLRNPELMALAKQFLQPSKSPSFVSWAVRFVSQSGAFATQLEENPLLCIRNTTTLHWACFLLLPELCQWLIEDEGQDPNRTGELGRPLHSTVCHGWIGKARWRGLTIAPTQRDYRLEVVKLLHNTNADIDAVADMNGLSGENVELDDPSLRNDDPENHIFNLGEISPLSLSVNTGTSSVFRYLLGAGAIGDAKCLDHFRGDKEVLSLIGETGINLRSEDRSFLLKLLMETTGLESSTKAFMQRLRQSLPAEIPKSTDYASAFLKAAQCGQHEVVETLLSKFDVQTDVSIEKGNTALHLAAHNDHVEVIKTLLNFGADVNRMDDKGENALHIAARRQDAKCVEILTPHVANLNKFNNDDMSAFHIAALHKNLFALKFLVKWAQDHDVKIVMEGFTDRRPFLSFAAQGGSLEVINYIMDTMENVNPFATAGNGFNSLHLASESASDSAVQRFLSLGLGVNDRTNGGFTPLFLAATSDDLGSESNKSLAVVKRLLENGADVNARTNHGHTALQAICRRDLDYDGYRIFEVLVEHAASINLKTDKGDTALILLCAQIDYVSQSLRNMYSKVLQQLVSHGAEVDTVCSHGDSCFSMVAGYFVSTVAAHLESPRQEDLVFATQLLEAVLEHAKVGSPNVLATLSEIDVWRGALRSKDANLITKLVEFLPDVYKRNPKLHNLSPMECACFYGCSSRIFKRLTELSGNTGLHERDRGWNLLHLAARGGQDHLVGELLDKGYALEDCTFQTKMTPFMTAAEAGHVEMVKVLIERGANINAIDNWGLDATHYACIGGHIQVLSFLTEHGLRTDRRVDVFSKPPLRAASCLHLAASWGNPDIIQFLMTSRADLPNIDEVTDNNETALFLAASRGFIDTVSTLLSYGADLEIASNSATPLHAASVAGSKAIVRVLLQAGADRAKKDAEGYTAETRALQAEHHEVVRILRERDPLQVSMSKDKALTRFPSHQTLQNATHTDPAMLFAMRLAIKNGDMGLCKTLLDQGFPVNETLDDCTNGCPLLLFALQQEERKIADFLIDRGAEIRGTTCASWNTQGYDPIHQAAAFGPCSLLHKMLNLVPDYTSTQAVQPIHVAVGAGCIECISALIDHDENRRRRLLVEKKNDHGRKSARLSLAPIPEDDVFEAVYCDKSEDNGTSPSVGVINALVDKADLKWSWRLTDAVSIDPDGLLNSATPLQIASWRGTARVVSLLLERGAALEAADGKGWTALHYASSGRADEVVTILLRAGANPNSQTEFGDTPAHLVAVNGHLKCLEVLVEGGADTEVRDNEGLIPLHKAAAYADMDVIYFLLACGGKVQTLSHECDSALHWAALSRDETKDNWIVDYLTAFRQRGVTQGTVINMLCRNNRIAALQKIFRGAKATDAKSAIDDYCDVVPPALIETAAAGHSEVLEILLDAGANIEMNWGNVGTALMAACDRGRLRIVQILVSRGAILSCPGPNGSTFNAVDRAKNHPEVVKWLIQRLGDQRRPQSIPAETVVDESDFASPQRPTNTLRRSTSCSVIHEDWVGLTLYNAHAEIPRPFKDLVYEPRSSTKVNVHEPRWARKHRLARFIFRASDSRASSSRPCDAWMMF